ncbi:transmembrane protease serine 12-like [Sceloporus undulatus]|uniref:transmembrane protease serine 12-like n=1 Tax=Sceloporus undulatus TaxID=8520 RepID=UPI001C4AE5A9|nr:transmembrane protease serine 12-like [Sceloporus undulatus]
MSASRGGHVTPGQQRGPAAHFVSSKDDDGGLLEGAAAAAAAAAAGAAPAERGAATALPSVIPQTNVEQGLLWMRYQQGVGLLVDMMLSLGHGRGKDPGFWKAILGMHHLSRHLAHTVKKRVRAIIIHSNFNHVTFENDIALFKLIGSVKFNEYIQPICLPKAPLVVTNETPCYISGWGNTIEKGRLRDVLQEVQVDILPLALCNRYDWYAGSIKEDMLCAGSESGGVDSCQGDSGGPLMCYFPDDTKYFLIGITSYGLGCGQPKLPGVYVRASHYRSWINSQAILFDKATNMTVSHVLIFLTLGWIALYNIL